jgi:hypothetical protein
MSMAMKRYNSAQSACSGQWQHMAYPSVTQVGDSKRKHTQRSSTLSTHLLQTKPSALQPHLSPMHLCFKFM